VLQFDDRNLTIRAATSNAAPCLEKQKARQAFKDKSKVEDKAMKKILTGIMASALILGTTSATFAEGRVATRQERQQQRIGNGVKNGSLTAGETGRLESREHNLNKEVRSDRKANGGNLTNNEKRQVNNQQNRLSNSIYRDKHNGAVQQH
jgi:hypothetical protein